VTRSLADIADVKRDVIDIVNRQTPSTQADLARHRGEIDELLAALSEARPEWEHVPCVCRVATMDDDGSTVPFVDNVVLPNVKHDLNLVLNMLNYIRERKGLAEVRMPLFVQPDEIALARRGVESDIDRSPARTLSDPELQLLPRRGGLLRRRGKRWAKLRRSVLNRDGWECTQCGATKDLQLHAVAGAYDDNDPAGYVTLCRRCRFRAESGEVAEPAVAADRPEHELGLDASHVVIRSQLALVFQKAAINWVGFVFGRNYVVLKA